MYYIYLICENGVPLKGAEDVGHEGYCVFIAPNEDSFDRVLSYWFIAYFQM